MCIYCGSGRGLTVLALDQVEELRGEVVAELAQGLVEFGSIDGTGAVAVEVLEDVLPVLMNRN